jgi:ABC-type sugar transport system substrate-binding protein
MTHDATVLDPSSSCEALTAHPNLDVVYSTTEQAAAGGLAALKAAKKDLLFISHDAAKEHVQMVADGDTSTVTS